MAGTTTNLGLYFKDPLTDGNDTFNIRTMLNENWDKLDAAIGDVKTPASKMGLTGDLSVGAALNVLANIGNVHVWQRVQTYADLVPYVDYLTSTDRNAYPDQSAEGGQDAYYSLGEVQRQYLGVSSSSGSAIQFTVKYSDSLSVSEDGTLTLGPTNEYTATIRTGYTDSHVSSLQSLLVGKFFTVSWNDTDVTSPDGIFFSPSDALVSYVTNGTSLGFPKNLGYYIDKAQPVTGYPAIPANNVITYLGQLGESGARIEVGSYVGTGTYGADNPNSLTFGFEPKLLIIRNAGSSNEYLFLSAVKSGRYVNFSLSRSGNSAGSYTGVITLSGNIVSWYADNSQAQMNLSNNTFHYIALG